MSFCQQVKLVTTNKVVRNFIIQVGNTGKRHSVFIHNYYIFYSCKTHFTSDIDIGIIL